MRIGQDPFHRTEIACSGCNASGLGKLDASASKPTTRALLELSQQLACASVVASRSRDAGRECERRNDRLRDVDGIDERNRCIGVDPGAWVIPPREQNPDARR